MFFSDWFSLLRIVVVGVCAYVGLVLLLRVYGKRSLSQFSAFDFVVTVALGSTLATILLSKDVALADGLLAFALLLSLQFAVTWLSVRMRLVRRLVKSEPRLVYYNKAFLHDAMRDERLTESELRSAIRGQGIADLQEVEAVVLETDGKMTVMKDTSSQPTSLADVQGYAERESA